MALIADGLLIATCLTAALYCYILSRRLKQFTSTEDGVGKQVRDLNLAIEEIRTALKEAQEGASAASEPLSREIEKARKLLAQLRTLNAETIELSSQRGRQEPEPAAQTRRVLDPEVSPAPKTAKLEAVAHGAQPVEAKMPELGEEINPEELNLEEMLAASTGEQQLGFLPDEGEDDYVPRDEEAPSADFDAAAEQNQTAMAEGKSEDADEISPRHRRSPPDDVRSDNLLKVERMAL